MEKLNIAELLKDCPQGMELDCTMYEDVYFDYVDELNIIHCYIQNETCKTSITFNQHGQYVNADFAKCVIFPKGKTTWEGFQRPFKDGDVVVAEDGESFQLFLLKHLTRSEDDNDHNGYCYFGWDFQLNRLFKKGTWGFNRLATEEEKAKLFQSIKDNGYKWNAETKTLEMVEPKFKVGDRITCIYNNCQYDIKELTDTHYTLVEVEGKFQYTELISEDKNWELVPNKFDIATLEPFDKVLVQSEENYRWMISFFGFYDGTELYPYICSNGFAHKYCIPYKGNEHLLGTTKDCDEFYKTWEK